MKRFLSTLLAIALLQPAIVHCQVFYNDAGTREKHFIYEIKQIDEFLDRFNDDKDSFIRKVYASYNKKFNIKRADLINSLFNYESNEWDTLLIHRFVTTVTDPVRPQLLFFNHPGWFAEVACNFRFRETTVTIPLVLKIDVDNKQQSRWLITGVQFNLTYSPTITRNEPATSDRHFIHPASHGNNFINLPKLLEDRDHLSSYFDDSFFKHPNAIAFFNALADQQLQIINIKSIRYHFMQIDGWIFTVEQFRRKALNSGWLINELMTASDEEKKIFTQKLIQD